MIVCWYGLYSTDLWCVPYSTEPNYVVMLKHSPKKFTCYDVICLKSTTEEAGDLNASLWGCTLTQWISAFTKQRK